MRWRRAKKQLHQNQACKSHNYTTVHECHFLLCSTTLDFAQACVVDSPNCILQPNRKRHSYYAMGKLCEADENERKRRQTWSIEIMIEQVWLWVSDRCSIKRGKGQRSNKLGRHFLFALLKQIAQWFTGLITVWYEGGRQGFSNKTCDAADLVNP